MKRVLIPLLALLVVMPVLGPAGGQGSDDVVLTMAIEGTVTRGTALHVADAIDEAEERGVPLVIRLDTPGGVVAATLEINREVARAQVPVLTYVGPSGAWAQSAGTFILLMGHPSGMAPNTQIGSAQPITQSGSGGTQNASQKVTNALVENIRTIADRTGRNQSIAERFITENLNLNATRALDLAMIDRVEPTLEDFVASLHGEEAIVGDQRVTLDTDDARIVTVEKGALAELVDLVSNPQIAFILFLVGIYGVIFGLAAPGTFVPETIGALLLVLGLIGLGLFDTSTSGLVLILLAAVFFVAEVFTPTHGILATAGVIALILGAIFLIDEPLLSRDFMETFRLIAIVSALVSGGVVMTAVWVALRTRGQPVETEMIGEEGRVSDRLDPEGKVRVHGELWNAVSEGEPIPEGERVVVTRRDGLTVFVAPLDEEVLEDRPESEPGDHQ